MSQVSGRSDITDFEEVVRLDKEYMENLYEKKFIMVRKKKGGQKSVKKKKR